MNKVENPIPIPDAEINKDLSISNLRILEPHHAGCELLAGGFNNVTPCFVKASNEPKEVANLKYEAAFHVYFRRKLIPYVVPFLGAGKINGGKYGMATELLEAKPLSDPIDNSVVWTTSTADKLTAIKQYSIFLAEAAKVGVVINDLAAKNALWDPKSLQVRAIDFESALYIPDEDKRKEALVKYTIPQFVGFILGTFGVEDNEFNRKIEASGKNVSDYYNTGSKGAFLFFDDGIPKPIQHFIMEIVEGRIKDADELSQGIGRTVKEVDDNEIRRIDENASRIRELISKKATAKPASQAQQSYEEEFRREVMFPIDDYAEEKILYLSKLTADTLHLSEAIKDDILFYMSCSWKSRFLDKRYWEPTRQLLLKLSRRQLGIFKDYQLRHFAVYLNGLKDGVQIFEGNIDNFSKDQVIERIAKEELRRSKLLNYGFQDQNRN